MDESKRMRLINQVSGGGELDYSLPLPVVSLDSFFDGNDDMGSIGCNLSDHPGIDTFRQVLSTVRSRADVQDVLVQVSEVEPDDPSMWPFSERVFVLTSASPEEVGSWLAALEPSEVDAGWAGATPAGAPELCSGHSPVAAWWD